MALSDLEERLCQEMLDESDRIYNRGMEFMRDMNLIQLKMTYELCGEDLPAEAKEMMDEVFFSEAGGEAEPTSKEPTNNEADPLRTD